MASRRLDGSIVQRTQYYPFGMAFADGLAAGIQPYKFGSKELDAEHGLMMYDYSARYYNGISFTSIDPLAEKYYDISPYVYCANNPMRYVDPTGMLLDDYYDNVNGKYLGNDRGIPGTMRLIDKDRFNEIKNYCCPIKVQQTFSPHHQYLLGVLMEYFYKVSPPTSQTGSSLALSSSVFVPLSIPFRGSLRNYRGVYMPLS